MCVTEWESAVCKKKKCGPEKKDKMRLASEALKQRNLFSLENIPRGIKAGNTLISRCSLRGKCMNETVLAQWRENRLLSTGKIKKNASFPLEK